MNRDRYNPQVEGLLRQFSIDGPKGTSDNFRRRFDFMYLPDDAKELINLLVDGGVSFDDAYDRVTKPAGRDTPPNDGSPVEGNNPTQG